MHESFIFFHFSGKYVSVSKITEKTGENIFTKFLEQIGYVARNKLEPFGSRINFSIFRIHVHKQYYGKRANRFLWNFQDMLDTTYHILLIRLFHAQLNSFTVPKLRRGVMTFSKIMEMN